MSASKAPSRTLDGPYASFATYDEQAQVVLANGAAIVLGQPLCLDLTNLGPDNNVANNGAASAQAERLVFTNSANAGPLFGVFLGFPLGGAPKGFSLTVASATNGGAQTYTNNSGATIVATVNVRQTGWGYVFVGLTAAGTTVAVGSTLIISAAQVFALVGAPSIQKTVGNALATAINTSSPTAVVAGAARVVTPLSMVGITALTPLLIDSLASGLQETVTPTAITQTTFTATFAQSHNAGFPITGSSTAVGAALITTGAALATGIIAAYIESNV